MKVSMITLKEHVYGGKRLKPDAEFQATGEQDARLLTALGRAKRKPAQQVAALLAAPLAADAGSTQDATTAPAAKKSRRNGAAPAAKKPRGEYSRRDMKAGGAE